eukprot:CAMPEP_0171058002 /NCGR_PEP_ID=MMETSP0766_2-20121228/2193_1 /TAXON_ID=439317 /ORGANISM="Gambierdiscus australes, Strain CAWD 149" /LENGTH=161 /DNA_ID=CAMNT_0011513215 /DNA_START=85 /DNA_END=567 /DNA_ORIENTATION=+
MESHAQSPRLEGLRSHRAGRGSGAAAGASPQEAVLAAGGRFVLTPWTCREDRASADSGCELDLSSLSEGHAAAGAAFGEADGLLVEEALARGILSSKNTGPDWAPPGGESAIQVQARMMACLDELANRFSRVVVVGHGMAVALAVRAASGISLEQVAPAAA